MTPAAKRMADKMGSVAPDGSIVSPTKKEIAPIYALLRLMAADSTAKAGDDDADTCISHLKALLGCEDPTVKKLQQLFRKRLRSAS